MINNCDNTYFIFTNKNSLSKDLCDDIIKLFEDDYNNQYKGLTASGVNNKIKDTWDLNITDGGDYWKRYCKVLARELTNNISEYYKKYNINMDDYNILNANSLITTSMQVQKYIKNTGKYIFHNDFDCDFITKRTRILTFLWYLNDVEEGGETVFVNNVKIKPESGKLVLFPASWDYPHKANVPISNHKYIITGWLWKQY